MLPDLNSCTVAVLGLSFQENCPDLRDTPVIDAVRALQGFDPEVEVIDPWVDPAEAMAAYGLPVRPSAAQCSPASRVRAPTGVCWRPWRTSRW